MNNDDKLKTEEDSSKLIQRTELLDAFLIKRLVIIACIYFGSYSLFSLIGGNTFGNFIATPLSAISFFLMSRWDRLRESKEISFQNVKDIIGLPKISTKILIFGIISIFFVQFIIGFSIGHFDNSDCCPKSFSEILDFMTENNFVFTSLIVAMYLSYPFGGYISAKLAIRRSLSPYSHAILSSSCFFIISFTITYIAVLFADREIESPFNEDASIGANVLFFAQFILLPLIGAKIAVFTSKSKMVEKAQKIENENKAREEFADIVALEVKRLEDETNKNKEDETTENKVNQKNST